MIFGSRLKKGADRRVLLLPELGIVIKISRLRSIKDTFRTYRFLIRHGSLRELLGKEIRHGSFLVASAPLIKRSLLANWREFQFYRKHKLPICAETWLSLGFINIQAYASANLSSDQQVTVYEFVRGKFKVPKHTFTNRDHFSWDGKSLKIMDYASPNAQQILLDCGEELRKLLRR